MNTLEKIIIFIYIYTYIVFNKTMIEMKLVAQIVPNYRTKYILALVHVF